MSNAILKELEVIEREHGMRAALFFLIESCPDWIIDSADSVKAIIPDTPSNLNGALCMAYKDGPDLFVTIADNWTGASTPITDMAAVAFISFDHAKLSMNAVTKSFVVNRDTQAKVCDFANIQFDECVWDEPRAKAALSLYVSKDVL